MDREGWRQGGGREREGEVKEGKRRSRREEVGRGKRDVRCVPKTTDNIGWIENTRNLIWKLPTRIIQEECVT